MEIVMLIISTCIFGYILGLTILRLVEHIERKENETFNNIYRKESGK